MKRILQLPDSIEKRNGRMSVIMNVYRKIDRHKVQFDFLATDYGHLNYADEIKKLGGKVILLPENKLSLENIKNLFEQVMLHTHYTYIHYHALSKWGRCISLAHKYGANVIVHSHATELSDTFLKSVRNRIFSLNIITSADKRVAVSPEAGKKLFMWQSFRYIPNMIDYDEFKFNRSKRDMIRLQYGIKTDDILIGMVGRISKQKNQIFALKILERLVKINKKYKLMIVGDADNQEQEELLKLKDCINKSNLSENVIFTGMVNNVQDYYSAFDIFWLTSLYEGMPTVGVEAQTNGLNVLVSDNVSRALNITKNVNFLDLKNSIQNWIKLTEKQSTYRDKHAYFKVINSNFNTNKIISEWVSLYNSKE